MSFQPRQDRCNRIDLPGQGGYGSPPEFSILSGDAYATHGDGVRAAIE
jgi:hypothetical protein